MYDPFDLPADCAKRIEEAARVMANEFGHSDWEDLAQEVWTWIGAFPKQSAKWWYTATDGNTKFSWKQFRLDIRRVAAEQARRDKRARLGLVAEDEVTYSTGSIEKYLAYRWHSETLAVIGVVDDGGPKAQSDKAATGDAMASALDVRTAYEEVITPGSEWDQTLFLIYGLGYTQQEAAIELQLHQSTVSRRVDAALEAIAQTLNGSPGGREYRTDGPGTRHVLSNHQAQEITSSEEAA